MTSYAFLGGAFDPIHIGHTKTLTEIAHRISFTKLSILPYNISPTSKLPVVDTAKRFAMTQLAVKSLEVMGEKSIDIQDIDIKRNTPAYTYDSLAELRGIYGDACHISFIIGDDCYATLNSWHRWDELCDLANLLVITRDNTRPTQQVMDHEKQRQVINLPDDKEDFLQQKSGYIGKLELPPIAISSSAIRDSLNKNEDVSKFVMPEVIDYIKQNNLYA